MLFYFEWLSIDINYINLINSKKIDYAIRKKQKKKTEYEI